MYSPSHIFISLFYLRECLDDFLAEAPICFPVHIRFLFPLFVFRLRAWTISWLGHGREPDNQIRVPLSVGLISARWAATVLGIMTPTLVGPDRAGILLLASAVAARGGALTSRPNSSPPRDRACEQQNAGAVGPHQCGSHDSQNRRRPSRAQEHKLICILPINHINLDTYHSSQLTTHGKSPESTF